MRVRISVLHVSVYVKDILTHYKMKAFTMWVRMDPSLALSVKDRHYPRHSEKYSPAVGLGPKL